MTDKEKAEQLFRQGNQYRRQSDWQHALECYNTAITLDSSSPATKAKEMVENILNYYCKAMFNP